MTLSNILRRVGALFFVMTLSVTSACGRKADSSVSSTSSVDTATYTLPLPEMPKNLTQPEQRAAFLADHYWDKMDWNDTVLLSADRFMGESMATYGALLNIAPRDKAVSAVNALINSLGGNRKALDKVAEYAYSYFYYPGAPQYDEELYLLFVNPLLARSEISQETAERISHRKGDIMKNRVDAQATDFEFIGTDGKKHKLLDTARNADYRLLMLYDPDCEVCNDAIRILTSDAGFTQAQKEGQVAVIAINAFGQEKEGKAEIKAGMPPEWTVGYSPKGQIDLEELYVIRATPAIYILDRKGKILQKDLSIPRLSDFVSSSPR